MDAPVQERLPDDAELLGEIARAGNAEFERATAIDRISGRLLEHVTGIDQVPTLPARGPLPPERLEAIEKLGNSHRDGKGLRAVTLSPQLAGAIAIQLADFAGAIDGNARRAPKPRQAPEPR